MLDPSLLSAPAPVGLGYLPSSPDGARYLPGGRGRDRGRREGMQGNLDSMEDGTKITQKPVKGTASEGTCSLIS